MTSRIRLSPFFALRALIILALWCGLIVGSVGGLLLVDSPLEFLQGALASLSAYALVEHFSRLPKVSIFIASSMVGPALVFALDRPVFLTFMALVLFANFAVRASERRSQSEVDEFLFEPEQEVEDVGLALIVDDPEPVTRALYLVEDDGDGVVVDGGHQFVRVAA